MPNSLPCAELSVTRWQTSHLNAARANSATGQVTFYAVPPIIGLCDAFALLLGSACRSISANVCLLPAEEPNESASDDPAVISLADEAFEWAIPPAAQSFTRRQRVPVCRVIAWGNMAETLGLSFPRSVPSRSWSTLSNRCLAPQKGRG